MEEWKPIQQYPRYAVSSLGRIKNLETGKIRNPSLNRGYPKISLYKKTFLIHQIVASTFLGPPPLNKEVNHIDLNKTNNSIENLEYVTSKENKNHWIKNTPSYHHHGNMFLRPRKLTDEQVLEIRKLRTQGFKLMEIAKIFNVTFGHIWKICVGTRR